MIAINHHLIRTGFETERSRLAEVGFIREEIPVGLHLARKRNMEQSHDPLAVFVFVVGEVDRQAIGVGS